MSGFQDEKSAGGGAVEKKKEVTIARPDPKAVAATVNSQIAQVKQTVAQKKQAAKDSHADKKSRIVSAKYDQIAGAADKLDDAIAKAQKPVIAQDEKIAELQRQLAAEKLERTARSVVFSAEKGELKKAYKQVVAGIKDTAATHLDNIKAKLDEAVETAQKALDKKTAEGGDTVKQVRALADAHDNWQSQMKWEGRKAGFNAVAATVKAIVAAVHTTYRENRDLARANVEIPAALREYHQKNSGPTPPAAS